MAHKRASTMLGSPGDSLTEALEAVVGDDLQIIAEYDGQSYELLHVSEQITEKHGGLEGVEEEAGSLFDYYHLDFLERDLLRDTLWLGEVETFVTFLDHGIILRTHTDSAAAFIAMDITGSIDDVQITIQNALQDT